MSFSFRSSHATLLLLCTLGALLLPHALRAQSVNLVDNGSFETPTAAAGFFTRYRVGQTFGNWTVDTKAVDLNGTYWQAAAGIQSLELSGDVGDAGAVHQDVPTISGKTYRVTFQLAGNPDGGKPVKGLEVFWGSASLGKYYVDTTGRTRANMGWSPVSIGGLTATGATRLTFYSLNNDGYGAVIDDVRVEEDGGPLAPAGLTVKAVAAHAVTLGWTDLSGNETGFEVERRTPNSSFLRVAVLPANAVSYFDPTVGPQREYLYRVRAVNDAGASTYTNEATAFTDPTRPFGVVSWWPGDAAATDLVGGNTGTTSGGVTTTPATLDQGFLFNGVDGRIAVADAPNLQLQQSLTISAWVRIDGLPPGSSPQAQLFFRGDNRPGLDPYYFSVTSDSHVKFHLESLANGIDLFAGAPVGQFVHFTATLDSGTGLMRIYANGVPVSETFTTIRSFGDLDPNAAAGVGIGNIQSAAGLQSFKGVIDDLRLYDRPLTQAEIQGLLGGPLSAPSALTATPADLTATHLAWEDNNPNESGFLIERKEAGGAYTVIAATGVDVTSYDDTGLDRNTSYIYRVRAYNAGGQTASSNEAHTLVAPDLVNAIATKYGEITVLWRDHSPDEEGFEVERAPAEGGPYVLIGAVGPDVTTYVDATVAPWSSYKYRVRAVAGGSSSIYIQSPIVTSLPPPPIAPTDLQVVSPTATTLTLTWTDQSSDEDAFIIERKNSAGEFVRVDAVRANVTTWTDTGLTPVTTYTYQVRSVRGEEVSTPSGQASGKTLLNRPQGASGLTPTVVDQHEIDLKWEDDSDNEDGFRIERSLDGVSFTLIATTFANINRYADKGLASGTTYIYRVKAYNAAGEGDSIARAQATTVPDPPPTPTGFKVEALDQHTIRLTWNESPGAEFYDIERKSGAGPFIRMQIEAASSYTDTNLPANFTITYRIGARNQGGVSPLTAEQTATTFPDQPGAPTNLQVTLTANTQASLTWTDTSNNEDSFVVERAANGGNFAALLALPANTTSYTDKNLVLNTTYTYRVRAVIGAVNSEPSNAVSITTPPPPPLPPSGLTATAAGTGEIDLAWTDGSANESGFRIERGTDGASFTEVGTSGANMNTYADQGLQPNTTYYYRVRAYNAGGASAYTNVAHAATAALIPGPPPAPADLHATGVTLTGVSLAWDAALGADSYEVERKSAGGEYARVGTPTGPMFTDGGLQSNTSYTYRARAVNAGGASPYSNEVSVTTPPNAPGAPANFHVTATTQSSVSLAWSAPAGPLTGYKLERSLDGNAWSSLASPGAGDTAYTDSNRQPGTSYQYRLRASNAGGDSPYAGPLSASTKPNAPAAPSELKVLSAAGTSIQLGWKDGSNNESGFVLERKSGAGEFALLATLAANTVTFTDTNVTAGVIYAYRVKARNDGGDSAYSNTVEALLPTGGKLTVSPANLNFGTVKRGKSSKKTVRVSNTGRGDLPVTVGALAAPFSVTAGGTFTLRPKQRVTVTVQFTPTGAGAVTGKLTITSNDPGARSVSVSLSGNSR